MKKSSVEPTLSNAQRRYFYFTATITGGVIMIVEILGAKMLSPYVGTSHFVWTAQIAVALIALSLGYYVGGRLVDRTQRVGTLYWAILFAALYLALTISVVEPVAYACLNVKPFALGSLLASLVLFFVPLGLLAMVGPFFVRVITSAVTNVGKNVGRLTALSTFGSFAGTVLIGYVLVPFLPNSITMYLTSLLLTAICLGYYVFWGRHRAPLAPVMLVIAGTAFVGFLGVRQDRLRHGRDAEKFYGNSNYGILQVIDDATGRRFYLNDYLAQNIYDPASGKSLAVFTYMLHGLARAYTTNIQDVLSIGLGVGIVPMEFAAEGVRVDAVEINPAVVPIGERFFGFDREKINLTIGDGRDFLNRTTNSYDSIALDAFLGESSPGHLMTREAFGRMKRVLRPGGTLVINSFGSFMPGQDFFTASLYRTLTNVFRSVRIHTIGEGRNIFFVASDRPELHLVHPPRLDHVHPYVRSDVQRAYEGIVEPGRSTWLTLNVENGRVLTDDFNPVEFFDASNRERFRRELAMEMKPKGF